jgi:hypothetical protein
VGLWLLLFFVRLTATLWLLSLLLLVLGFRPRLHIRLRAGCRLGTDLRSDLLLMGPLILLRLRLTLWLRLDLRLAVAL